MNNKKIYIILFAILYLCVALVSTIHAISFFGLANASPLAIILAIAFEIGQAAVLFSILTDSNQQKRVMPWVLMSILTLVQVMGNVYNSYKYLILNSEDGLRFFKEPIFVWTQIPDNVANVILSYIIGAILPIVSLLMTAMVTGFLNKKEEVKEEPKIEEKKEEQPKITIDKENGIIDLNTNHTPSHKDIYIPLPEENKELITKEEFPVKEESNKENDEIPFEEELKEDKPINEPVKEIEEDKPINEPIKEEELPKKDEEKEVEFPHEIINDDGKKSHLVNF